MVTYLYWAGILTGAALVLGVAARLNSWKTGLILALVVLLLGWSTYYFRLQQVFVKRYGGVMSIHVPANYLHIGATWKDDNLWVENYDPATNTCIFSEYSKGNLLQGKVTIKNCNPVTLHRFPDGTQPKP
ncbi:hypothetical protein [Desulforhopalus singaporensis]|uniref:Uncharacterized protein n=1 Tax=Desulforhopalus singaporensis TaxID=91360 RepID=A0A1H0RUZ6_9BACT|nr:hypothetical protein [Desulforhopalus singaporensis]SDP33235.1 hypothetical protein SAMN05660330_02435 [Desulforhopalus singaporensis]